MRSNVETPQASLELVLSKTRLKANRDKSQNPTNIKAKSCTAWRINSNDISISIQWEELSPRPVGGWHHSRVGDSVFVSIRLKSWCLFTSIFEYWQNTALCLCRYLNAIRYGNLFSDENCRHKANENRFIDSRPALTDKSRFQNYLRLVVVSDINQVDGLF